jgi:hypothetical protein
MKGKMVRFSKPADPSVRAFGQRSVVTEFVPMKSAETPATPEQCRLLAQACEKQAATADLPLLKSAMLKLGEQWRELASERERQRTAA